MFLLLAGRLGETDHVHIWYERAMKELFKVCSCHLNNPRLLEALCEHRAFLALSRLFLEKRFCSS
jgi:hypothetical protein